MRWRIWLTRQYLDDWLGEQVYYRLELEHRGTDNPDQRIQDDLRLFTDGTLTYALGLLRETVTVASFIVILWNVSSTLPLTIGGVDHSVPGYLVWAALAYAVIGSALTYYVGRPLIRLNFQQEQREADFRYALVRLRENAEGVALYRGEAAERRGFMSRVERIRENWWGLMDYTKRLNTLTIGYNQMAIVFPYFMAGHRYFTGALTLGNLTQIADAFGQVQTSLSWFVNNYSGLANWKASVDRLLTFHRALEETRAEQARHDGLDVQRDGERTVRAEHLDLVLPNGRTILADTAFTIEPGERVVLTGPSGAGKSTLFRALAGIWPFGRGRVRFPGNARALFLPQKPYIPIGALRDAVAYPGAAADFGDDAIRTTLAEVGSAATRRAPGRRAELEPAALRRRAAAAGDRARAAAQTGLAVHGRGDVGPRRGERKAALRARRAAPAGCDAREHRAPPGRGGLSPEALQPRARRRADAARDRSRPA